MKSVFYSVDTIDRISSFLDPSDLAIIHLVQTSKSLFEMALLQSKALELFCRQLFSTKMPEGTMLALRIASKTATKIKQLPRYLQLGPWSAFLSNQRIQNESLFFTVYEHLLNFKIDPAVKDQTTLAELIILASRRCHWILRSGQIEHSLPRVAVGRKRVFESCIDLKRLNKALIGAFPDLRQSGRMKITPYILEAAQKDHTSNMLSHLREFTSMTETLNLPSRFDLFFDANRLIPDILDRSDESSIPEIAREIEKMQDRALTLLEDQRGLMLSHTLSSLPKVRDSEIQGDLFSRSIDKSLGLPHDQMFVVMRATYIVLNKCGRLRTSNKKDHELCYKNAELAFILKTAKGSISYTFAARFLSAYTSSGVTSGVTIAELLENVPKPQQFRVFREAVDRYRNSRVAA